MKKIHYGLITGATSGIGKAMAYFLSNKKIPLMITGRNSTLLKKIAAEIGADYFPANLSNKEERKNLLLWSLKKNPDLIINAAGYGTYGWIDNYPIQEQMDMLEVNASALSEITLTYLNSWKEKQQQGTILNIASLIARAPFWGLSMYSATKCFVREFSLCLFHEAKRFDCDVLCSCPGPIPTQFQMRASKGTYRSNERFSTPLDKVTKRLWKQIQKGNPIDDFPWTLRFLLFFTSFLPKTLISHFLWKSIKGRCPDYDR
jgi:uncharacterized protein